MRKRRKGDREGRTGEALPGSVGLLTSQVSQPASPRK